MMNVSFQDDFDFFRARGEIGLVLSIEVPTDTPEIGTVCPVAFNTCGMPASLTVDEQLRFRVSDGDVIFLQIQNRPYRLRLFTVAAEVTLTLIPRCRIPQL